MSKKFLVGSFLVILSLSGIANDEAPFKKKPISETEASAPNYYLKLGNDVQRYAKKFIGTRYRRGGKAANGFDCSGFVIYVFKKFGMKLGACSTELVKLGYDVETETAMPGDLIFFRRGTNPKSGVSHVGIVVEYGKNGLKFIHSASSKGVTVSYLQDKYYSSHFVGVRRVIDCYR
ncbi:D-gamma-glutamyl-meso-diaminopimelic acid endopeptidase CwlS [Emticicia aquatica]|uniref:D-gamma-glutamyl-meso-diaminopimelic acid endopeptidase CwlS n=1 Tax=Emticicia aquatica TaxID=1681835 RepID=A0ABM9AWJ9_9BACT|nr:C40 family peptidase [Emticicia aquatica]CAH0997889.1 D-gamma-glutamyl-meso-diaminopimelic acid endopeptidase CwlS [Emticicia aquatica]